MYLNYQIVGKKSRERKRKESKREKINTYSTKIINIYFHETEIKKKRSINIELFDI
jgi:hypothetical protein